MQQSHSGQGQLRIFVDLPDGRTVGAAASQGWQPPEAGSAIKIDERVLLWGGKSYRILP
jgi:hypothetical protein